jgi:hypothetical protein
MRRHPLQLMAAFAGMAFVPSHDANYVGHQIVPRQPRRSKSYRVNSGTRAQERYKRRISAGKIPESQILRGAV